MKTNLLYIWILVDEQWKDLDYPGIKKNCYRISNHGRIYSKIKEKFLNPTPSAKGYPQVSLRRDDGEGVRIYVHRLVAWHFVEGHSADHNQVNHKDGVKHTNYFMNLEWVTGSENMIHAFATGLNPKIYKYPDTIIERACQLFEEGHKPKQVALMVGSEFPNLNIPIKKFRKYISEKVKMRLSRTDISSKYNF